MVIRALFRGIRQRMKYDDLSFLCAVKEELFLIKNIMGLKLYVKYMNGIAKAGIDYVDS